MNECAKLLVLESEGDGRSGVESTSYLDYASCSWVSCMPDFCVILDR